MTTAPLEPMTDPAAQIEGLDAPSIRHRLAQIARERAALLILLRAAMAAEPIVGMRAAAPRRTHHVRTSR